MALDSTLFFYSAGTISLTNGSDVATGQFTAWDTAVLPYDFVVPNNGASGLSVIAEVLATDRIRLAAPWSGQTLINVPYFMVRWTRHTDPRVYAVRVSDYLTRLKAIPENFEEVGQQVATDAAAVASALGTITQAAIDVEAARSQVGTNAADAADSAAAAAASAAAAANAPPFDANLATVLQPGTGAVARSLAARFKEVVSVKDYGAKGDGATNDAPAFQAALNYLRTVGGTLFIPSGRYLLNSTVTLDLTTHTSETDAKGVSIVGAGANSTVLINGSGAIGLNVRATMANDALYSYFNLRGVTITKSGTGTSDIALNMERVFCSHLDDVTFRSNTYGFKFVDVVLMTMIACRWRFNTYGLLAAGQVDTIGSTPNAITFFGCIFYGQAEYAGWFEGGCNINFYGGSIETTSGGSNAQRFGVKLSLSGRYGGAIANFNGVYFERNGNIADVWITNGNEPNSYLFENCTFNRQLSNEFSENNILLETNSSQITNLSLVVSACSFRRYGSYTASASRPYIKIVGTTPVNFRDIGNLYWDNTERPLAASLDPLARVSFNGTNGAIRRGSNVQSVVRNAVGDYTINFYNSNPAISSGRTYSLTADLGGFHRVVGETATSVRVMTSNTAGTNTDAGTVSVVVWE